MRQTLLTLAALSLSLGAHADAPATSPEPGEDKVTEKQSVDTYGELEDAQAGVPGKLEERLWLTWGYVPAEGNTPSDTLELSYTPKGKSSYLLRHAEFDLGQYFEHDDVDNTSGFNLGWMQRWVKDGGRKSWRPSIGTLTEYYLRTPILKNQPKFAPGATTGDHVEETLTIAKYLGPGTAYLNGFVQRQIGESNICTNEADVAYQPADAPDQNGAAEPNYDGCDYWAPWTLGFRVGYNYPILEDKLNVVVDYIHETNEFTTQSASTTLPDPEQHLPYEMGEVSLMWRINEHWTLSPGALFGLDGREETPAYEAGLFILHE